MSIMSRSLVVLAALALGAGLTGSALATPQFMGMHRDWSVWVTTDNGNRLCYIASEPSQEEGDYARRGAAAVLVSRLAGGTPSDEVSVQPGYNYQADSEVEVVIDGDRTFRLFTRGSFAWARSSEEDQALIDAMRGGLEMTVRGTSTLGTYSLDTYSLLGFTAAHQALDEVCD